MPLIKAFISVTLMARTRADARARDDRVMPDFLPQWCEGQEKLYLLLNDYARVF